MARRTIEEMSAEVLLRMGNRTDVSSTQRLHFLQDAYLLVAKSFDHKELQGGPTTFTITTQVDRFATTTTDLWWPMQVRDESVQRILIPEDQDIIDNLLKYPGPPDRFYWWKGLFVFNTIVSPVPRTFSVKYKIRPEEIAPGGTSVLDELYDLLIIMKAAQIGFETSRDLEQAGGQAQLYNNYVREQGLEPVKAEKLNDFRSAIRMRFR